MYKDDSILLELIFECPLRLSGNPSCPFNMIRKLPVKERILILSLMNQHERERLLDLHLDCFEEQVETKLPEL